MSSSRAAHCAAAIALVLLVLSTARGSAEPSDQRVTANFKDAELGQIAEAVSAATGRTFIIDPRVRAQVTMLSSTPMSADAFYQAFLAILQVHGFAAVPAGNLIKIIPDANARQSPANDLPDRVSATSDELVTQVIAISNVSAAQLVPILRPLIPQYGHLAAYPASNMLIISDRAANVNRLLRIIQRIDQASDATVDVIPVQHASAGELVRIVTLLYQTQAAADGGGAPMKLVADERSNSLLISGDQAERLQVKALIAHLDSPLDAGGDTQVRYVRYGDAEKIAAILKEQVSGVAAASAATGSTAAGSPTSPAAQADRSATILADPDTNALILTASPKTMRSLQSIIDQLDIRRAQVLVEAIIVEIISDKSAEFGVNWAVWSNEEDSVVPAGGFIEPVGGTSIIDLAQAIDDPASATTAPLGTTFGIGRLAETGLNFAAMLRALQGDADSNVLATPSAVTLDNQEAELKVAQEVPFLTGQYASTTGTDSSVNPFQTIEREEVGTILKVTPQINEGDSVLLKIELESSSLAQSSQGAVDLITNKRTIHTSVLIEDGGVVVLGGLIQDASTSGEQRVPYLGRIPLLGTLFRTRSATGTKTNLMVFIRPKILRDAATTALATHAKYNALRDAQRTLDRRRSQSLLSNEAPPILPPLPETPAATPETPAPTPDKETL